MIKKNYKISRVCNMHDFVRLVRAGRPPVVDCRKFSYTSLFFFRTQEVSPTDSGSGFSLNDRIPK